MSKRNQMKVFTETIKKTMLLLMLLIAILASLDLSATTVTSVANGNWSSGSTWSGGSVPSTSDCIIINTNVTLNTDITVGKSNNGGLTINAGKSLVESGSRTISMASNDLYTLTNNGTLTVSNLEITGGSCGSSVCSIGVFVNNGTATISTLSPESYSEIINSGTLTVSNDVEMIGTTLWNKAGGQVIFSAKLQLSGTPNSRIENYGIIYVNSSDPNQAFNIDQGTLNNYSTGRFYVPNGKTFIGDDNIINNYNYFLSKDFCNDDNSTITNTDSFMISNDFICKGSFIGAYGSYHQVKRYLTLWSTSATYQEDGYTRVFNSLINSGILKGNGKVDISQVSTNVYAATISGSLDICDSTKSSSSLYVDYNWGTIGSSVTKCAQQVPCSSVRVSIDNLTGNINTKTSTANTYSIPSVSGASYLWIVPSGFTISSGGTTNSASISMPSSASSGIISVRVITSSSCTAYKSIYVTAYSSIPAKPASIQTCEVLGCTTKDAAIYTTAFQTDANTYTWTIPNGWTYLYGQGTNSICVLQGPATGTVTVVANNGYGSSTSNTVTGNGVGKPANNPVFVTGNTTVCASSSQTYAINTVVGATSYSFTYPTGWTKTAGGASTDTFITLTTNTASGNVVANATNSCGTTTTTLAVNTLVSVGTVSVSGNSTTCSGSTLTYSVSVSNATGYTWSVPTGWTINSGQGTTSIGVTTGTTSGNVSITATGACSSSSTGSISVTVTTTPTNSSASISGNASFCAGTSQTFTVSGVSNATNYTWTVPSGWNITAGQGTSSITATVPSSTSGSTGSVSVLPSNGTCNGTSVSKSITINPLPSKNAGADKTICVNTSTTVGATATSGNSYAWTSSPSGFTSTSANPSVSPSATTTYYLVETNSSGCKNYDTAIVTVNTVAAAGTITGNSANCSGTTSLTYSISTVSCATTYTWTVPTGWVINAGQGTTSITVTAGSSSGNITVTPSAGSYTGTAATKAVTTNPLPTKNAGVDKAVCLGSSTTVGATATSGNTYAWTSSPSGFTSTSANPSVSPSATTTYYLVETNSSGCKNYDTAIVTVNPLPGKNAGIDQTITGTTATLAGNNPGTGYTGLWTVVSGTGTFSNSTAYNSTVSNVKKCSSVYLWTVTNTTTGCKASDDVMINVDNKAVYTYSQWNNKDTLKPGVVIATPIDVDTAIISSAVKSGYSLPNGFALNSTNGKIYVYDSSLVKPGYYCLNVITTDACNRPSDISACFTVRKDKEAVTSNPTSLVKATSCLNQFDILANFSDSNGTIFKSYVSEGQLPKGMTLVNSGTLSVTNLTALKNQGGHFIFTIRTIDSTGGSTFTNFDFTLYKEYPAYYVVNSYAPKHNFTIGEAVAFPIDSNGIITSATITSGSLPPGVGFNTSNGKFTITNLGALNNGSWVVEVATHDNYCGVTTSYFAINFTTPLPVDWLSFNAEATGNNTSSLNWSTATELNNSHFEIERSFNGLSWNKVGQVKGNGTSNVVNNYNKLDIIPSSWTGNVAYYRIKQVDFNGKFEYSKTEKVSFVREASSAKVWYNMNETKFMVKYNADKNQLIQIALTDMASGQLKVITAHVTPGVNNFTLEAATIAAGMYNVIISSGNDDVKSFKVIKY